VLFAGCRGGTSQAQQFDGDQARRWVEHQVAAGPRIPNTPGHRAIAQWLEQELRARADTVELQPFTHVTRGGDTLHLVNILARFRSADPNRVLFVTHWDTRPHADNDPDPARRTQPVPGANDGASGTAVLLGVADQLKRRPPSLGVDLLFVDGEDYGNFDGPDVLLGSTWFAQHQPPGYRPLFGVLFDMVGGEALQVEQEGYSLDGAPEVVERVWTTAEEQGLGRVFRNRRGGYVDDDHVPLLRAGLRVIDLIDVISNYPPWHTTADTPDKVSARTLANVGRLAMALVR
jgi:hypothetical protein